MSDGIYVAKGARYVEHDGRTIIIRPGATVREGHPLLKAHPDLFEPIRVQYDLEQKTETRPAAKKTADKTETR